MSATKPNVKRPSAIRGSRLRTGTTRGRSLKATANELSRSTAPRGLLLLAYAVLLIGASALAFLPGATMHALNAAGAFSGTPISDVQTFVDKLKGNLVWLGGTAMGWRSRSSRSCSWRSPDRGGGG